MAALGWGAAAEVGARAAPWWAAPLRAVFHLLWGLLLWINSYLLQFNHEKTIVYHYDVDVRLEDLPGAGAAAEVPRPDLSAVKAEFFRVYTAQFPAQTVAYDGQRSLLSPALHGDGDFWVAVRGRTFHVTLKLVKVYGTFEGAAYRYVEEDVMYFG